MNSPRKPETLAAYETFKQENTPEERALFNLADETIVREYDHWVIIHSRFPYDTMARVNDLLILKRPTSRHADMTDAERDEYETILAELAESGDYDAIIENFTRTKSVPKQLHMHLICWHLTE